MSTHVGGVMSKFVSESLILHLSLLINHRLHGANFICTFLSIRASPFGATSACLSVVDIFSPTCLPQCSRRFALKTFKRSVLSNRVLALSIAPCFPVCWSVQYCKWIAHLFEGISLLAIDALTMLAVHVPLFSFTFLFVFH